jgi:hypothetical protein
MVFAHIFGIPVEETTLALAPVTVVLIVGAHTYARQAHRKVRAGARRRIRKTNV